MTASRSVDELPLPPFEATPLVQPLVLSAARVAIVSTAGLHRAGDPVFQGGAIDWLVETLARFAAGEDVTPPEGATLAAPRLFRYLAADAKSFYSEAATAQPSRTPPSGEELARWLYTETTLGEVLFRVRARLTTSDDPAE